ncbi:carbon monoxide dehydrogenase [Streptomyces sp. NBC_01497]|uniref:carbon monoxide dehydrogenase n=1 Tax=Streptomyces sp. NBC_01497 TaxID=2903885 RepID=UPI002E30308F|nr:carbon monoxide dehydrogenase [Streptomyces sp. NBC_01497]
MDHEVFVPVTAAALRRTLRDPARVAHCVPAFQQDAESEPGAITGRLKVRAGGHTITYRGTLGVTEEDDGVFTVRAEGEEVRGTGSVSVTLDVRLTPAVSVTAPPPGASGEPGEPGTTDGTDVGFTGVSHAQGRLAELPRDAATQAARRLLDRFAARLGDESGPHKDRAPGTPDSAEEAGEPLPPKGTPSGGPSTPSAPDSSAPSSPDTPLSGETVAGDGDFHIPDGFDDLDDADGPEDDDGPPAEAAHARRTMIGRSAEEVDHAPPRGRYAPVPLPEATTAVSSLRWVAPAAALALASAVVVTRALRRRR